MSNDPIKPPAPDRPALSGRTVEITDEDESIVIAFLPVVPKIVSLPDPNQPEKGKLP